MVNAHLYVSTFSFGPGHNKFKNHFLSDPILADLLKIQLGCEIMTHLKNSILNYCADKIKALHGQELTEHCHQEVLPSILEGTAMQACCDKKCLVSLPLGTGRCQIPQLDKVVY